jgi:hypothetical protein
LVRRSISSSSKLTTACLIFSKSSSLDTETASLV